MDCINLQQCFGRQYRIDHEESYAAERPEFRAQEEPWLQIIPGARGHVFPWGSRLAASTNSAGPTAKRLRALPFVEVWTDGSDGVTVLFDADHLDEVAVVLGLRRRRRLSPEARQAAAARLANYRFRPAVDRDCEALGCVAGAGAV